MIKKINFIVLFITLSIQTMYGAIQSATGNIKFDVNSNGNVELVITTSGVGIGVATPQANLHIAGNAIVSDSLTVGGTSNASNSNIHINGTLGFSVSSYGTGANQISNSSYIVVDTSSGNVNLQLPALSTSFGQSITIKRTSLLNNLTLSASGNSIDNVTSVVFPPGNYTAISLVNDGTKWVVLNNLNNETIEETGSNNLFLWWKLDETSGNIISDSSSNHRSANLTNEHSFSGNSASGPLTSSLLLDDSDDTALYDDGSISSSAYTYALWSKYNYSTSDTLDNEPEISGTAGFVWSSGNSKFHKSAYHKLSGNSYATTPLTSTLSANTWYHIAVTWNGSEVSLYLNGQRESGNTAASWIGASNIMLTNPGVHSNAQAHADDLRFFNKALGASDIQSLYLAGNP